MPPGGGPRLANVALRRQLTAQARILIDNLKYPNQND